MSTNKIDIKALFLSLQKTMKSELQDIRENTFHEPTKGSGSEYVWLNFFNKYLPKRYAATKAIIIDHEGNNSDAIDAVIYDIQYTPFLLNRNDTIYIPVESVYAIFEIKQEVSKSNLEYAANKIKSVRVLNRTSAPVIDRGEFRPAPKLFEIIGGFLALENTWKDSISISKPFNECISNLYDEQLINLGCVLNEKSFVLADKNNPIKYDFSTDDEALIYFFLKLVLELQKLGTVRPIDLNKYIDQLDSQ